MTWAQVGWQRLPVAHHRLRQELGELNTVCCVLLGACTVLQGAEFAQPLLSEWHSGVRIPTLSAPLAILLRGGRRQQHCHIVFGLCACVPLPHP